MTEIGEESAYERMGRTWLGLGNLDAPVWFIGMEPGGKAAEDPAWSREWVDRFGGAPMVDLHVSAGDRERRYLGTNNRLHATWSALIRFRLAYAGEPADDADVLRYQRERFAKSDGGEALLEVSAYAASSLSDASEREAYRERRLETMKRLIRDHRPSPEVVVCYGKKYADYYAQICGGAFDDYGFHWSGDTLCALTLHPYQARGKSPSPDFWIELGHEMRRRLDRRRSS